MESREDYRTLTLGAAAAALLAASIGCGVIGAAKLLTQVLPEMKSALTWYERVGSLSGETGIGIIVWLVSWLILHKTLQDKEPNMVVAATISFALIALSIIFLFPPVYLIY